MKIIVLVLTALIFASTASATPKIPKQNRVIGTLVSEGGIGIAPGVPTLKAPRTLEAATATCDIRPFWNRYTYRSRVGFTLWTYTQQVYACFVGGNVTYLQHFRWFQIPDLVPGFGFNPWKFKGNVDNSCDSEHCTWTGQADSKQVMTRGWFEACAVPFVSWLCNDQYPMLTITVYGNGTYDHTERAS